MPAFVIKWVLPLVVDLAIKALKKLSTESDNTIDDKVVGAIEANKKKIIKEIKRHV